MLLIGAGLLMRSLTSLRAVDPGFDARNVLTASIGVPMAKYDTEARRNQFFDRVRQRRQRAARRGCRRRGSTACRCRAARRSTSRWKGMPPVQDSELPTVAVRLPSPGYFAHGAHSDPGRARLHRGRRLRPARRDHRQRAHRAALLAGAESARQARHAEDDVARAARGRGHRRRDEDRVARRRSLGLGDGDLRAGGAVRLQRRRADGPHRRPARVAGAAAGRRGARHRSRTAGARRAADAARRRGVARPASARRCCCSPAFATLALVLASVGIYSVLAYTVRQRVREIGIRMALGAPSSGVLRMVVVDGLKPTAGRRGARPGAGRGAGPGDGGAAVRRQPVRSRHVHRRGWRWSCGVGLVATLVPAWRATRVDPIVTLRSE